jgi:Killing trait
MAFSTTVNDQITDAVTQANVKVLADAPAQAMATIYQVMAQTVGLSMQNSVANQQNMNTIDTSVTTQGVNLIYSMPVAAGARGTNEIFSGNALAETLADLKASVQAFKPA